MKAMFVVYLLTGLSMVFIYLGQDAMGLAGVMVSCTIFLCSVLIDLSRLPK